jgi:hypothetical protein
LGGARQATALADRSASKRKKAGGLSNPKVRLIAKPEPRKTSDLKFGVAKKWLYRGLRIETGRQ